MAISVKRRLCTERYFFHGDGTYSIAANAVTVVDSAASGNTFLPAYSGTYTISASGYGFLSNPYTGDSIYGSVSNGIFTGSSTDNSGSYNDLFVAVAVSGAGNATFSGPYSSGLHEFSVW